MNLHKLFYYEDAKRRPPAISLSSLRWKAMNRPETMTEAECAKLEELEKELKERS